MPNQFQPFNLSTDVITTKTLLHEAIPMTGTIVSGTYADNNIKNYSHGMFQSVFDYPYLSSSANHIFDITAGYSNNGPMSASANTQNLDKINIYKCCLIKSKNEIGTVGIPASADGNGAIFLLNTGQAGNTQPLVQHFLEKCKQEGFRKMLKNKFKKYNDASIEAFLKNEGKSLLSNVKSLSKVLYDHFQPMIPKLYRKLWKDGIESNAYYLKLCGSGGGGYILGFTENLEVAQEKLSDYQLDVIHRF